MVGTDGVRATHVASTQTSDGRFYEQVCADLQTKVALSFGGLDTRGPAIGADVTAARRDDLASRGLAHDLDAHGCVDLAPELAMLAELLLAPALPHVPPGAPIAIMPHLTLNQVPWSSLPLPTGEPLVEAHAVSVQPSLTTLSQLLRRASSDEAAAASRDAPSLVVGGCTTLGSFKLPPAPFGSREMDQVAAAMRSPAAAVLSGDGATARLVGSALADGTMRSMHLACHARPRCLALSPLMSDERKAKLIMIHDSQEELVAAGENGNPGAMLAAEEGKEEAAMATQELQAHQEQGPLADGLLMMDTLTELPLHGHPTITLSGSHAAAGHVSNDWVIGLPRAFLVGGARSVLASSWDVADEPACLLVSAFYNALADEPTMPQADALRAATLMLRAADGGRWAHPAFWAGFAITGAATGI